MEKTHNKQSSKAFKTANLKSRNNVTVVFATSEELLFPSSAPKEQSIAQQTMKKSCSPRTETCLHVRRNSKKVNEDKECSDGSNC